MKVVLRRLAARAGLCVVAVAMPSVASSQTAPAAPTERAQRDADKVFRMILQHADTPRRVVPAAPAAAPTPAPRAAADARATARPPLPAAAAASAPVTPTAAAAPAIAAPERPVAPAADTAAAVAPVAPPVEFAQPPAAAAALPPVASLAPVPVPVPTAPPRLELVSSVEPEYPSRLLRSLGSGKVLVNFDVRPDGTVARSQVVSSPHRGLNAAAEAAVLAWRFKPTGQTLPGQVELRFE
jgi:TonB family protein